MRKLLFCLSALWFVSCASTEEKAESSATSSAVREKGMAQKPAGQKPSGIDKGNFDPKLRAVDDFYLHTNGTWLATTEIPADRSNYGTFTELFDNAEKNLRIIIEEAAGKAGAQKGSTEQKVGDAYKSFLDEAAAEKKGLTPLAGQLQAIDAVKTHDDVARALGQLSAIGAMGPFVAWIDQDAKDATKYALYLHQSGLSLPDRDYYLKDDEKFKKLRTDLGAFIGKLWTVLGKTDEGAEAAQQILALETELAQLHWTRVDNRDREKTYNNYDVTTLEKAAGGFNIRAFYEGMEHEFKWPTIVRQPTYLEGVGKLFRKTPVKTWKRYLTFRLVDRYAPYLHKALVDAHFAFQGTAVTGVEQNRPRWKRGVAFVETVLGEAVGKLYVERHFSPDAKAQMDTLVKNLKVAFGHSIDGLDWMSKDTKKAAHDKLAKFVTKIGYPDKWKDYTGLEVKSDDLVGNLTRSAWLEHRRELAKLGKPIDRTEWFMTPQTVNAYYNSNMNEIVFPAAILQPPFFDPSVDMAANYGAIGAVIGHEISHGFDDQGRKSDGDGNLRDWWKPEDAEKFKARAQNLVAQYNAYAPFDDAHVNGELTLGENIGDLGGLTVAYAAYRLSLRGQEPPVLDGLTGDQRFFYGWSQIWRRKYRDEELRRRLLTDPHSPSHYRVIGIVSNIPAFYAAFDVKPDDKMFLPPEKRVKIW